MSYNFNPLSDEELDLINLMCEGYYNFEVVKSTRKVSKSGNDMCELQLRVWDEKGVEHILFDYLVFSLVPLNIRKVKHFCDAVGLQEEYKKGNLPEELDGKCGVAQVGIREPQPKGDGSFYPKKNIVLDYCENNKNKENKKSDQTKKDEKEFNDDLPF